MDESKMSRRHFENMERHLEPPENYLQEPEFCEECKHEECLLDLNKNCPEWDKADRQAHAEWLENKEDNNAPANGNKWTEY